LKEMSAVWYWTHDLSVDGATCLPLDHL